MKKIIGVLIVLAILAVIAVPRVTELLNNESIKEEVAKITVSGEEAKVESIITHYELIGNTFSNKTVPLMPSIPAEVLSINVKVGDYVNEGDILFTLSGENIEGQVTQAELGVEQATAALNQANVGIKNANAGIKSAQLGVDMAKSNYEMNLNSYNFSVDNLAKYEELYKEGIVSEMEVEQMRLQTNPETLELLEKQLEQAEQGLSQAQLGVEQANSGYAQANVGVKQANEGLETATEAIENLEVTAPVSGYITAQNLTENVMASNASVAMMIDELRLIKVSANVTANQVGSIIIGDKVDVYISANNVTYVGVVETINLTADTRTMLYPITIIVENKNIEIKPGMFATVKIVEDAVKDAIVVPTQAVVIRDGISIVFIYEGNNKAIKTEVTIGVEDGYRTQILSGVNEGDIIITNGVGLIDEDTMIEVVRGDE